jgi:cytochrome c biogenesis protein
MEKQQNKTVIDIIWEMLASVKLAVIIFFIISLSSMIGTFLEQDVQSSKNMIGLTKIFGESLAPTMYEIFYALGFMDMYHSWWFLAFLLLFTANLIICSVDRLPRILKLVNEKIRPLPVEYLEKMSIRKDLTVKGKSPELTTTVQSALRNIGFRNPHVSEDEGTQVYAEKWNFTRLGVYITHSSILIILAGAIIGSIWGFNAYLPLNEGETSSVAYVNRKPIPLGFEIRCDNFVVDFYGSSDTPKDYKSWLTVFKNGREVKKQTIEVNNPLEYEGITFYQSSYGSDRNRLNNGIVILRAVSRDGQSSELNLKIGDTFTIPGTTVEGHITDFSPALSIDRSGKAFTYSEQMNTDGNNIEFLEYWGVEYTGMQVRKDPGVLIVYLGCIIMGLGLYITFFMSHRKIWVHVSEEKNRTNILIGASTNKNKAAFETKVEKLVGILGADRKGGK